MKLRCRLFAFLVSAAAFVFSVIPASAQTIRFAPVDVAVAASPDEWYRTPTGRSLGVVVGAGAGPFRVEVGWPSWHKIEEEVVRGTPFRIVTRRTVSTDFLYLRHYTPSPRSSLSWLAGGGYAFRTMSDTRQQVVVDGTIVGRDQRERRRRDHPALVGGLDFEVAMSRRLAFVSQFRLHMYPFGPADDSCCGAQFLTAEPRVGVRWRFN